MGFRKRNANRSDNRSKTKVIMGKPASELTKEEKKVLAARLAEIRSENGGKNTVQNTIPFLCMYKDGVCQVSENFFSLTVQFFDANYSISEFDEQNNIFSKYCDVINLFDNTIKFQLTFENQNRTKEKLIKQVQILSTILSSAIPKENIIRLYRLCTDSLSVSLQTANSTSILWI